MTKNALVTGNAGFIGRHFADRLTADGWTVLGCDLKNHLDARNLFAIDASRFDLVIHCAAMVGGRAKIDGDPLAIAQNLAIDSDAFRWAVRTRPHRFVYFSSSAAYPVMYQTAEDARPLREDDIHLTDAPILHGEPWRGLLPWAPDSTYGWAKLTGELLAKHARAEGVNVHTFRPFSGYGADQDLDYPFPQFIARALGRDDPFEIWGDGTQTRDFIHVDDIVDGVLATLDGPNPGPLNLCTGIPTSFLELAALTADAAGYQPSILTLPDRPTGVHTRVGDPTAFHHIYQPRISLEEGIHKALTASGRTLRP